MVLVHVTAFKGHHKIQGRWENRECVVEKQPYPNVPVYVVCPRDGQGCSQTLHRNYLLPINSNIGQSKKDAPMAGVENNNTSTPAPPVDCESADAGLSGTVTPSAAGNMSQGSPDQPAPLRWGTWKTQNWLPWRYQNFSSQAGTRPPNVWDAWAAFHAISSLYNAFWGSTVWTDSTVTIKCLPSTTHLGIEGTSLNVVSMVDFGDGGEVNWRLFVPSTTAPLENKLPKDCPHRDPGSVQQPYPENQLTDTTKSSNNMSPGAQCDKWN